LYFIDYQCIDTKFYSTSEMDATMKNVSLQLDYNSIKISLIAPKKENPEEK